MSKYVVSSITYGSTTGYAKSHSTTLVPEISDVDSKASINEVERKERRLIELINRESSQRVNNDDIIRNNVSEIVDSLTNYVDNEALQRLKSELLSNDRLSMEKNTLQMLIDELISKIQTHCQAERALIHEEVEEFKRIDLNSDLDTKLQPVMNLLNTLITNSNGIQVEFQKIGVFSQYLESVEVKIEQASANVEQIQKVHENLTRTLAKINDAEKKQKEFEDKVIAQTSKISPVLKQIESVTPYLLQGDFLDKVAGEVEKMKQLLAALRSEKSDIEIICNKSNEKYENEINAMKMDIAHLRESLCQEIIVEMKKEYSLKAFLRKIFRK